MHSTLYTELQFFYDQQAEKFSGTRKRHRPEFDHVRLVLQDPRSLDIVELGCGDWRLFWFLTDEWVNINTYKGIDFSVELIWIAKDNFPRAEREAHDMLSALEAMESESVDCIIAIASFQHLLNKEERQNYLNQCYRVLRYGGTVVMTNRSYSQRFLKRFRNEIASSLWRSIFEPKWMNNDILIPRKTQDREHTYHRYYHIFRLRELENLFLGAWFIFDTGWFINKEGQLNSNRRDARNTFCVWRKQVYLS